jgi:hypothetical protein
MFEVARAEGKIKGGMIDKRFSRQDAKRQSKIFSFFRLGVLCVPSAEFILSEAEGLQDMLCASHLFADSVP